MKSLRDKNQMELMIHHEDFSRNIELKAIFFMHRKDSNLGAKIDIRKTFLSSFFFF